MAMKSDFLIYFIAFASASPSAIRFFVFVFFFFSIFLYSFLISHFRMRMYANFFILFLLRPAHLPCRNWFLFFRLIFFICHQMDAPVFFRDFWLRTTLEFVLWDRLPSAISNVQVRIGREDVCLCWMNWTFDSNF